MRPLILKGHTRPLTCVKYNTEGDLLFSCSKDSQPTIWRSGNGERIGTYTENGHRGTVWHLDVTVDSKYLVTGGADMTCKVWEVETGKKIFDFPHTGPVRHVEFSEGSQMIVTVADPFRGSPACVSVYEFDPEAEQPEGPKFMWEVAGLEAGKKLSKATWMPLNKNILTADEFGAMRLHEVESGRVIREVQEHTKRINAITWNKEKYLFMTGSADCTAILWDAAELKPLKTYPTERPVNAVGISPIKEHVFVAGGQDARSVTTTSSRVGKFETKLFHMVFADAFGSIKGHFGPVNTLAVHPEGTGFTSGSEDGYVRVHEFDPSYFEMHSELDDLSALQTI
mmetsp:Transcript_5105/g.10573  ORF Transcript_5105/g.10573 Transcript_5105/m.10573 type:complete len:340 (+) Transcript_5105:101-1120(+)